MPRPCESVCCRVNFFHLHGCNFFSCDYAVRISTFNIQLSEIKVKITNISFDPLLQQWNYIIYLPIRSLSPTAALASTQYTIT